MALLWTLPSVSGELSSTVWYSPGLRSSEFKTVLPGVASAVLSTGIGSPSLQQLRESIQNATGLPFVKGTWVLHIELSVHQDPQIPFCKAAFQVGSPQCVSVHCSSAVSILLISQTPASCTSKMFFILVAWGLTFELYMFKSIQQQYHNISERGPPVLMRWEEEWSGRGKERNTRVMIYHFQLDCWTARHNLCPSHDKSPGLQVFPCSYVRHFTNKCHSSILTPPFTVKFNARLFLRKEFSKYISIYLCITQQMIFCLKKSNIPKALIITGTKIMFTSLTTVATHKKSNLFKKKQWLYPNL